MELWLKCAIHEKEAEFDCIVGLDFLFSILYIAYSVLVFKMYCNICTHLITFCVIIQIFVSFEFNDLNFFIIFMIFPNFCHDFSNLAGRSVYVAIILHSLTI